MTTYRDAGVDIDHQDQALAGVREKVRATFDGRVISDLGAFGGLFRADFGRVRRPVLVSSADGVGTKLRLAFMTGRHDSVGRDLVNHCVNDILVQGAEPLFFLDYLATGRLDAGVAESVIGGVADACRDQGMALLGGETAEMPGFYGDGEYDLAGFIVGVVDERRILDGSAVKDGDVLVGLPSSGLHTNGYSLARKILFEQLKLGVDETVDEIGCTVGEELLRVHRCYLTVVRPLLRERVIRAMAHITGGGLTDNLPRVLPDGLGAVVKVGAWDIPPIFRLLARMGHVPEDDLWRTFNMGVGMVLVVGRKQLPEVLAGLQREGFQGFPMGRVERCDGVVYDHPPEWYPSGLHEGGDR